ncbi:MAG TPA: glycosyltransferase [Pirellula sp.]|nr:glycosyltransferase [Pirellula sp.]
MLNKPKLYIFGWPSDVGGADTKLAHLLLLLHEKCDITVVPNENRHLHDKRWTRLLDSLHVKYSLLKDLPNQLSGWGLAMSNHFFFTMGFAEQAKQRGLRIVWSSEMMWHHDGELTAVRAGVVDKVLYTSELQKQYLAPNYGHLPSAITGNYIDSNAFPFVERHNRTFTIGRLSRAAPEKYPEDFPVFYEKLGLPEVRFRVMAWDDTMRKKYLWHQFDSRWELLRAAAEPQVKFLQSLDLFVYPLGHRFIESWGRSTVEAMLTGAVALVPAGHHLENLVRHEKTGFVCSCFEEFREYSQRLFYDIELRKRIARLARAVAEQEICNKEEHVAVWMKVFND